MGPRGRRLKLDFPSRRSFAGAMQLVLPYPDIDPELVSISLFGVDLALRWYALAYIAAILIGWWGLVRLMRAAAPWPGGQAPMPPQMVEPLVTWLVLGIILGGRLGFVLFYRPGHYLANPAEIPALWQGGMAFHGGLIGVALAVFLFARRHGVPLLSLADALAMVAPPGLLLGRLANFINAELWGTPGDVRWAMVFPTDPAAVPRHPSQLYEAGLEGIVLGAAVLWLGLGRRWLARPGAVTGMFLAGYGLARFFVERFRQADAQFITPDNPAGHVLQFAGTGLSMGQILSLPLVAAGLGLILFAWRRRT